MKIPLRPRMLCAFCCTGLAYGCGRTESSREPDAPTWEVTRQVLEPPSGAPTPWPGTLRADEHGGARFVAGGFSIGGFTPDGSPSAPLGREGKGPGEFDAHGISPIGFVGDTTWVIDFNLDRLTFFDGRNALARTVSPTGLPTWNPGTGIELKSLNAAGTAFLVEFHRWQKPESANWSAILKVPNSQLGTASVLRDAQRIDSVGGEMYLLLKGGTLSLEYPFSDSDIMAFAPNGSLAAVVRRKVTNASSPSFTLTVHGTTGLLRTDTIRSAHSLVPINDSIIEAAWLKEKPMFAILMRERAFPSEAAARNAYLGALKAPSHLPPVAKVLVGNDSTIWLERPASGAPMLWEVYDSHGKVLGRFSLPRNFTAETASGNFIWGMESDEDGNQQIVRYRVRRQ
jgi:hypothetical protein